MYHIEEFHDLSSLVFLVENVHLGVEAAPVPHQVLPRPHDPRVFAAGPFTYDFWKVIPLWWASEEQYHQNGQDIIESEVQQGYSEVDQEVQEQVQEEQVVQMNGTHEVSETDRVNLFCTNLKETLITYLDYRLYLQSLKRKCSRNKRQP